ncbi:MAG: hypothetical protein C5B50_09665 [Verrucomicrobia bacterium]|nr:MAG: hypothetical protein C5B50_09665 [Verrucomicrobiota bacterium]
MVPCLIFEDEDLLVVNKPAGLNTHSPSPYAGEGIYDWLRHREPRWAKLAIIQRLDKETSGVLLFAKTNLACRSLTDQFASRTVRKKYLLLTDRKPPNEHLVVKSVLVRAGERYLSRPPRKDGQIAETIFRAAIGSGQWSVVSGQWSHLEAEPLTGRTHQIRVHAADKGFPILGDALYGGTSAPRLCLHAAELRIQHPRTGEEMTFQTPADFDADTRSELRTALIDLQETNAFRLVHGASDHRPGLYVDRFGDYLLVETRAGVTPTPLAGADPERGRRDACPIVEQLALIEHLQHRLDARGVYYRQLGRQARGGPVAPAIPKLLSGEVAPDRSTVRENGLRFELSLAEGASFGLFLDQRDNRRRLLARHIATDFPLDPRPSTLLNAFSYTCGFSVCAAKAGFHTTSLDLSRKYLEWGKRNFGLNGLDADKHDFIFGDVFDWFRRLAKKGRTFDVIMLDPPTFSQSKVSGVFRAQKDFGKLVSAALTLLAKPGILFSSSNAADWPPEDFVEVVKGAVGASGRKITQGHYVPQPPDFPISKEEPGYLKTMWLRIE